MRKKLLALLMCATMVLGSSVVATAAPSDDDYKNAEKIFKNSVNYINEKYKEDDTVKETKWVKSLQTNATYGFDEKNDLKGVKLNSDSKPLKYVGDYVDLTGVKTGTDLMAVVKTAPNNGSVTIKDIVAKYIDNNNLDDSKTVGALGLSKVAVTVIDDVTKVAHVQLYSLDSDDLLNAADVTFDYNVASSTVTLNAAKTAASSVSYKTADGYSNDVDGDVSLFKADTKDVTGAGIKCIKFTDAVSFLSDYKATTAKALETGALTKDAVAVVLKAYSVVTEEPSNTNPAGLKLNNVDTPTSGYTVTGLTDLLSRTNLKGAVNVFKFNTESPAYDHEMGAKIYPIGTVASNVDVSGDKFTVDVAFTDDNGVIIFDQAEVADKDNAGQADADKGTTDTAKKMGDTAPIAALAVVMLGAFGAMVVASKKRA